MSVRPWSRTKPFAGRQKAPQRHQLDYTIHWPELRSVDFTAAAEDNFFLRSVDASEASLLDGEMQSVFYTAAPIPCSDVRFTNRDQTVCSSAKRVPNCSANRVRAKLPWFRVDSGRSW